LENSVPTGASPKFLAIESMNWSAGDRVDELVGRGSFLKDDHSWVGAELPGSHQATASQLRCNFI